jgi:hypothetical protein
MATFLAAVFFLTLHARPPTIDEESAEQGKSA